MKKLFSLSLVLSLFLGACGAVEVPVEEAGGASDERLSEQYPVIYVSVFTHVEQKNSYTPDFVADEDAFWEQRELVVEFANMLYEKGVGYDYQSDWNFLAAMLKYDEGTESTNGKNLLRYLYEDLGVSVDPHNHTDQSEYNSADVAYLIDALGVPPSGVAGGFIAAPASDSTMEDFWQPIEGNVYDYTWTPTVLWGGGTLGHQGNEEALWASGIWRPQDAEHFDVNDDSAPIAVIGHYQSDWEGLDMLLEKQASGELEMGKIYTISVDAHQKKMSEEFIQEFAAAIDSYQSYTDEGQIQWVTLAEVYEIWQDRYDSVANIFAYDGEGKASEETDSGLLKDESATCGDGTCSLFEKKMGTCTADCSL